MEDGLPFPPSPFHPPQILQRVNPLDALIWTEAIAIESFALFQQVRQDVATEIGWSVRGNMLEHIGLQNENARVDPVAGRVLRLRFFNETRNSILCVKGDDAAIAHIGAVVQGDSGNAGAFTVKR